MTQITKLRPVPRWESPPNNLYPIIKQQGIDYQLVPLSLIEQLKTDRENLVWLATGAAAMAIAAAVALVAGAFRQETKVMTIDKPVIVEKQVVVPTNCVLFCK